MVKVKEVKFQEKAVKELVKKIDRVIEDVEDGVAVEYSERELLFTAPVASGKTIMVGKVISELKEKKRKEMERVGYVWLSSGKGNLHEQSMKSMTEYINGLEGLTIEDVINKGELSEGEVLFANWESLRQENNIARKDGDRVSIDTCIKGSNIDKVILFIDEAHESRNTKLADGVIKIFNPTVIVNITATPKRRNYAGKVTVDALDVVNEGFIKKKILVNNGLISTDSNIILDKAVEKRLEIEKEFKKIKRGLERVPLCLIQIENDSKVNIVGRGNEIRTLNNSQAIREMLLSKGVDDSKIAIWVSDKESCQNLENIKDSKVEYLIFKQAIATGWDCPRSHILVRFRDVKSESFDIQTIGRILRTLEKKHYGNEIVDNAYIYTEYEDMEIKFEMDDKLRSIVETNSDIGVIKDRVKEEVKVEIMMEKRRSVKEKKPIKELHKRIQREIVGKLSLLKLDKESLKGTLVQVEAESSKILNGETSYGGSVVKGKVSYSDSQIRLMYVQKIRGLYTNYGVGSLVDGLVNKYIEVPSIERDKKLYKQKVYLSHVIEIENIIKEQVKEYEYTVTNSTYEKGVYEMPKAVRYKNSLSGVEVGYNYAYTKEPNLSVEYTKSKSEVVFGKYLNNNPGISYWYKNGTSNQDFSIVYQVEEEGKLEYKEYYPDMIVVTKDKRLIIVDVKAGIGKEDYKNVSSKYLAGKRYEKEVEEEVKGKGFSGIEVSIVKDISKDNSGIFRKAIGNSYDEDVTNENNWVDFLSK